MSNLKSVVVTGCNKGIGFEIARSCLQKGYRVIMSCRNQSLGEAAIAKLKEEAQAGSWTGQLEGPVILDLLDQQSIVNAQKEIAKITESVDVLINNAGFAYHGDIFGYDEAKLTIETNYKGTAKFTDLMIPILKGGRVITVASMVGALDIVSPALQERFSAADLTRDGLDKLVDEFLSAVKNGDCAEKGWPRSMYGISKLCVIAYCRILAREFPCVAWCCPGWCATDMSSWKGPLPASEGADTPVWLAEVDAAEIHNKFWASRKERTWKKP